MHSAIFRKLKFGIWGGADPLLLLAWSFLTGQAFTNANLTGLRDAQIAGETLFLGKSVSIFRRD